MSVLHAAHGSTQLLRGRGGHHPPLSGTAGRRSGRESNHQRHRKDDSADRQTERVVFMCSGFRITFCFSGDCGSVFFSATQGPLTESNLTEGVQIQLVSAFFMD